MPGAGSNAHEPRCRTEGGLAQGEESASAHRIERPGVGTAKLRAPETVVEVAAGELAAGELAAHVGGPDPHVRVAERWMVP